jgi:hypothetical protein
MDEQGNTKAWMHKETPRIVIDKAFLCAFVFPKIRDYIYF